MRRFLFLIGCVLAACTTSVPQPDEIIVRNGADLVFDTHPDLLKNKRIGFITNHTALTEGKHLADMLHAHPDVNLVALFAPEHGIRGKADAGALIDDEIDPDTGLPVFSLHGEVYAPTPEMMDGIELLLFDTQDVGTRFYTYINTMGLSMQVAAQAGIPFVVLDRPNPIGGEIIEGFGLDVNYTSFIGMYPMPVSHGMTIGEIARMIQGEKWLPGLETLDLHVVPMQGWHRDMLWTDTGQTWIAPSPNLPTFDAAMVYPGTCFFGSTLATEGRGTYEPFIVIGAPWLPENHHLADSLNARNLPGVRFEPVTFTLESIPGMATNPRYLGQTVHGIRHIVTDAIAMRPVEIGVHTLHAFYHSASGDNKTGFFRTQPMLNVSGGPEFYQWFESGASPAEIIAAWQETADRFRTLRSPYLMY